MRHSQVGFSSRWAQQQMPTLGLLFPLVTLATFLAQKMR